jgi:ferredoxin
MDYVDITLLLLALSTAAYFVLVKRSRRHILVLMVASLIYFGFLREGCVCPIGSIQNVTLALFQPGYTVPVSVVVFFLAPLLFTLFFGRGFCASVCPLGAMQDIVVWRPIKLRPWLEQALGLVPFLYLGLAVLMAVTGTAFIICEYDPFVAFFRRNGSLSMLLLGGAFLGVGLFVGRPYCRFLCPYGAILSLLSRVSKWNVTLAPSDCLRCQICDHACPYGAISDPTELGLRPPVKRDWRIFWVRLALIPLLVSGGALLGRQASIPLSQRHDTVRLAERIAAEEAGQAEDPTKDPAANPVTLIPAPDTKAENLKLASKAFRQTGRPKEELYAEALRIRRQFDLGAMLLGALAGFVLAAKLAALVYPSRRSMFEPDRSLCVACGRCYSYCPKEISRVKKLGRDKSPPAKPAAASA